MDRSNERPRGRPRIYQPPKIVQEVHLQMTAEIWDALRLYANSVDAPSLSAALRAILKERLKELGYLKEPIRID